MSGVCAMRILYARALNNMLNSRQYIKCTEVAVRRPAQMANPNEKNPKANCLMRSDRQCQCGDSINVNDVSTANQARVYNTISSIFLMFDVNSFHSDAHTRTTRCHNVSFVQSTFK